MVHILSIDKYPCLFDSTIVSSDEILSNTDYVDNHYVAILWIIILFVLLILIIIDDLPHYRNNE